jgi:superfamily I DNA and/or RNA helicase
MASHFENMIQALQAEMEHEKKNFENIIQHMPMPERVANGLCWYPIQIEETGYGLGDYPFLSISIDKSKLVPHQFKSGSMIRFFQQVDGNISLSSVDASVAYVSQNQCKIVLESDDFPEWMYSGKLGIILDYDQKSYQEMILALHQIQKEKDTPAALLREILEGKKSSQSQLKTFTPINISLNPSQINAIQAILDQPLITVLHGPPGTGKTTTLVEAIYQKVKLKEKILVAAPSNNAVDLIVEKLSNLNVKVLRIGHLSRINQEVVSHTLEYKIEKSSEIQTIKKLRKEADNYRKMAMKYKRNFGKEEREQRRLLLNEAKAIGWQIKQIEDYMIQSFVSQADVICTTLVGSAHSYLKNIIFDTVFIDETSQALEPATWIPILKSKSVVLAGDPFQLPPTVKSDKAMQLGLAKTLLDRAFELKENVFLIDTQYRMHPSIMAFSNLYFYQNQLKSGENVLNHYFEDFNLFQSPLVFIDTAGCAFDEIINPQSKSIYNPEEANFVLQILDKIYYELTQNEQNPEIAVISPYKQQTIYLNELDFETNQLILNQNLQIHTIDSFQGQEKDVILISLVRSNTENTIGFLSDYRRMNVALTRARKLLVVVGDSSTIGNDLFYKKFIDYTQENGFYHSAYEYMDF